MLSNEYQHDRVKMFFKNLRVLVLWTKVALKVLRSATAFLLIEILKERQGYQFQIMYSVHAETSFRHLSAAADLSGSDNMCQKSYELWSGSPLLYSHYAATNCVQLNCQRCKICRWGI